MSHVDAAQQTLDAAAARVAELEAQYRSRKPGEPGDPQLFASLAAAREDQVAAGHALEQAQAADDAVDREAALHDRRRKTAALEERMRDDVDHAKALDVVLAKARALFKAGRETGVVRHGMAAEVMTFGLDDHALDRHAQTAAALAGTSDGRARAFAEWLSVTLRDAGLQDAISPYLVLNRFALDGVAEPRTFASAAKHDLNDVLLRLPAKE